MCWNAPISWITFILGTIINVYIATILPKQYRIWAVFFQLIITVQLGEALIWGGTYSHIGSYIAFFCVWLQPIMLSIILNYYNVKPAFQYTLYALLAIYFAVSIPNFRNLYQNEYQPELCGDGGKHIDFTAWDNGGEMGFMYLLTALFGVACLIPQFPYVGVYLVLTMVISLCFYARTYASLWCWFAVFSPLVYYAELRIGNKL